MRLNRLGIVPLMLAGVTAANSAASAQGDPPEPPIPVYPMPPAPPPAPVAPAPVPAPPPPTVIVTPAPPPAPVVQAAPPPPLPPYRRCSSGGRGYASIGSCALRVVPGQVQRLHVRIERNLSAPPAALILIWRERDGQGGMMQRISGRALGSNLGTAAGTVFAVPIPDSFCKPTARRFDVEMELADGRNVGVIGQFSFPCTS